MRKPNWTFAAGLLLAAISLSFSATGLTHLFAGAGFAIPLMAISFELAKVTGTVWLMTHGFRRPLAAGLLLSILCLSFISSLGIYGYLGRSYSSSHAPVVVSSSRSTSLSSDVTRLQQEEDRLNGQIEAIPASQGTNRRLLTRTLQPQIEKLETSIAAKRDSLSRASTETAVATNDIGEFKFAAELLGTSQDGIAKLVITVLAVLLDPLAVLLVMASGVKGKQEAVVYDIDLGTRTRGLAREPIVSEQRFEAAFEPEPAFEPAQPLEPNVVEAAATLSIPRARRKPTLREVLDPTEDGTEFRIVNDRRR